MVLHSLYLHLQLLFKLYYYIFFESIIIVRIFVFQLYSYFVKLYNLSIINYIDFNFIKYFHLYFDLFMIFHNFQGYL